MTGPLHPQQGSPAAGWILSVIEYEAICADVDRTIALWITSDPKRPETSGISANEAWFELTRERRRYASWEQIKGEMLRWAWRDQRKQSAQLLLPGFGRRAA